MRWKRNVFLMLGLVMGIFWGIRQSEVTAFAAEQTGFWIVDNSDANSGNSGFRAESGTAAG